MGVGEETEAESIATTFRDALGEGGLLVLDGTFVFLGVEVGTLELVVERLEIDTSHDIDGVNNVTLRLAHLLTILITNHGVEENFREGNLLEEVEGHHDHTSDPEEENIMTSFEERTREEAIHVVGLVGPSHSGEGPEGRAKPSVKNVGILFEFDLGDLFFSEVGELLLGLFTSFVQVTSDDPVGLSIFGLVRGKRSWLTVEHNAVSRDTVTPPDLARNTPRLDVFKEVLPSDLMVVGSELEVALVDGFEGHLGHFLAVDEPLGHDHGFDNILGTRAARDTVGVGFDILQQSLLLEGFNDVPASSEAVHSLEFAGSGDKTLEIEDDHHGQVVALTTFKIVGVVSGGDLDDTSTEGHIDEGGISDDGDLFITEGALDELAVVLLVTFIIRMDSDGGITNDGFGTSGGNDEFSTFFSIENGVGEVSEETHIDHTIVSRDGGLGLGSDFFEFDFEIRDGGLEGTAPVDEASSAVDLTLFVELDEGFLDGGGALIIHGEAITRPVAGSTEKLELIMNEARVLLLVFPNAFEELFTAKIVTGLAFVHLDALFDDDLSGDTSVVRTRDIQDVLSVHTLEAADGVLDSGGEGVTEMETTSDVGRRKDDDELAVFILNLGTFGVGLGVEVTLVFPPLSPLLFDFVGVVASGHFRRKVFFVSSSSSSSSHCC